MTKNTRRTIFYALLGLFFLIGAGAVLYAQGWRLDFATLRAEKVGAIYLRSFPQDAKITLDGKSVANQSGFLSHGTLLSDLFPKNYDLTLTEDGYADWHERALVLPSLVTEFKYAVLVPNKPIAVSTSTVKSFLVADDGTTVTETGNDADIMQGKTIGHGTIAGGSMDLKDIIIKNPKTGSYSLYDFEKNSTYDLSKFFPKNISAIMIDPYDPSKIIAANHKNIWTLAVASLATSSLATIAQAQAGENLEAPIAISPSKIAWAKFKSKSDASTIAAYDLYSETSLGSTTTVPGQTLELARINDNLLGVLQSDGALYSYDLNASQFKKLADDVRDFAVADDGTVVAALEHQSLEILPLTDAQTYLRFNLPEMARVEHVIWYKDARHLFVVYPNRVSFLDFADLGLRNFTTIGEGSTPLYKSQENVFYLINPAQKLSAFDFPQ